MAWFLLLTFYTHVISTIQCYPTFVQMALMDCWDFYWLIPLVNMSTDCQPICRTRVGQVLVDMLFKLVGHWLALLVDTLSVHWFTFCCHLNHNITAVYRSTIHGVSVDCRWYVCIVNCCLLKWQQSLLCTGKAKEVFQSPVLIH